MSQLLIWTGFRLSVESNLLLLSLCFTSLCDWLTKLAPLSQPMRSQTAHGDKTRATSSANEKPNRAWCRLHAMTSNSDWFTELFSCLVIGQSDCFGFRFTLDSFIIIITIIIILSNSFSKRGLPMHTHFSTCWNFAIFLNLGNRTAASLSKNS